MDMYVAFLPDFPNFGEFQAPPRPGQLHGTMDSLPPTNYSTSLGWLKWNPTWLKFEQFMNNVIPCDTPIKVIHNVRFSMFEAVLKHVLDIP